MNSAWKYTSLCILVILGITSVLSPTTQGSLEKTPLFIFGDSILDAGNNNYIANAGFRANFWPYGETFFKYPTGRFSDGRIIADFVAEYLKLPLISPYLEPGNHEFDKGVNFASAGAGALDGTYPGLVINLNTQLVYFKKVTEQLSQKLGKEETKTLLSGAIYTFSIGGNDYIAPFYTNSTILEVYSKNSYVEMVIGNLSNVIQDVYKIGGRKFAIVNVGPLGCLPLMKALKKHRTGRGGCLEETTELAKLHNIALAKVLKKLQRQLQGLKYIDFDLYTAIDERINHPSKYGFKVGKEGCCGSGPYRGDLTCGRLNGTVKEYQLCDDAREYLFFDNAHQTEKTNRQIAELMWTGSDNLARPYNLKKLLEA